MIGTEKMTYNSTTGVWSATLSGDHKNQYYTYLVKRDNVTKETVDPYARAVGANGNRSLGVGAIGGMLIGTIALLFIVPVLFVIFQTIEERVMPKKGKGYFTGT